MTLERELVVYRNKETGMVAYVNTAPTSDPVERFVRFCVKSNEEFKDTRIYLIDCLGSLKSKSFKEINSFLGCLVEIDSIKGDNDVVYILRVCKSDLSDNSHVVSSRFKHFLFDENVENNNYNAEYYIYDHAQVDVGSLVADMQSKLERSGEKWH